ncbi:DUF1837 domain-containing protein [Hyphomonas sp.]|uniref:HamA C-terminal domain-containing protein n=1 Tax=Hyphomonas sp. TaxID=87 RepID=UPI003527517A
MPGAESKVPEFSNALRERLLSAVRRGPKITDAHLQVVERDVTIDGTKTRIHCYGPQLDAHGRLKPDHLVDFLMDRVVDYAVPRQAIERAEEEYSKTKSAAAWIRLQRRARDSFTDLEKTGEGGELLLFALAEAVFELAQILCKMSLKTSTSMHYHGADGVYASSTEDGFLDLYWGESKLYQTATAAITDCLSSLAPFLREEFSEDATNARDMLLLNEYADLTDPELVSTLKRFFDRDEPQANKLRMCGFALVGFDSVHLPSVEASGVWEEIEAALKSDFVNWRSHTGKRLGMEKISHFDIHVVCVPLRSVDDFRAAFLKGLKGWQ